MSLVDAAGAVTSEHFAEFRGRTYPARQAYEGGMRLEMDRRTAEEQFPDQATDTSPGGHVVVTVPTESLDRWFARDISAVWKGRYPVSVQAIDGDRAGFHMPGASAQLGAELGLTGDQYSGFYGACPVSELTDLEQEIRELPLP